MKRKVIIWHTSVSDLINSNSVGGIAVQLYFWSQAFSKDGWDVYSLTKEKSYQKENINFLRIRVVRFINVLVELLYSLYYFLKLRPDLIIMRGASVSIFTCVTISKLLGIKAVLFGASDVNFIPGKELFRNNLYRKLYQKSLKNIDYFVVQNECQKRTLKKNYGKESLKMFNIWGDTHFLKPQQFFQKSYDVVWIANLRRLKRVEWIIEAARQLPHLNFAVAGSPWNVDGYYDEIKENLENTPNITYLKSIPFYAATDLAQSARILTCTSEFEGFPNTFLQAWSAGVPVVSTVDPSDIIKDNNIGIIINSVESLINAIVLLTNNHDYYKEMRSNINLYFNNTFSPKNAIAELKSYLGCI